MKYNQDGTIATTTVDGNSFVGLFAADGSVNVVESDGSIVGVYHPSGALHVTFVASGPITQGYAADGSLKLRGEGGGGAPGSSLLIFNTGGVTLLHLGMI